MLLQLYLRFCCRPEKTCSHILFAIFVVAPASCPPDPDPDPDPGPTDPTDPDTGRDPDPGPFEVCQETIFWTFRKVVPCMNHEMCEDYRANKGNRCCLSTRCICGTDADAGGCASFNPVLRVVGPGVVDPSVTVPTVPYPTMPYPPVDETVP
jgi:hypothetical protein